MIEATSSVNLKGPGYRAMSAFSQATGELPLDPLLRELNEAPFFSPAERAALALTDALTQLPGNPLPDDVVAAAERELGEDGLAAATWVIITINAWNRVAIAGHERAGEYEPA